MRKTLDWAATEDHASVMNADELVAAYRDAVETAEIWDRVDPDDDPDGNAGYYHDEASVYFKTLTKRADSVERVTKRAERNPSDENLETLRAALAARRAAKVIR